MGADAPFPPGKLNMALLERALAGLSSSDPRVVTGPRVGEDAAVIDFGDRYLVAKTDPITFATDRIGAYAVAVNANDIATRGATPRWFLATVLLPEAATDGSVVEDIFEQLSSACDQIGVCLVGGHTEVTIGLDRPIIAGVMLGEVARDGLVSTSGLGVGDAIILTKAVPIEGVAIIAREARDRLLAAGVGEATIRSAVALLDDPGILVTREAAAAVAAGGVTSMHDPTEGGIATALLEMAHAAGLGLRIRRAAIPLVEGALELCGRFGIDPLGTISSGALLIGVSPGSVDDVLGALAAEGIPAARIGSAVPADEGTVFELANGACEPIPYFERDEIARIFQ